MLYVYRRTRLICMNISVTKPLVYVFVVVDPIQTPLVKGMYLCSTRWRLLCNVQWTSVEKSEFSISKFACYGALVYCRQSRVTATQGMDCSTLPRSTTNVTTANVSCSEALPRHVCADRSQRVNERSQSSCSSGVKRGAQRFVTYCNTKQTQGKLPSQAISGG